MSALCQALQVTPAVQYFFSLQVSSDPCSNDFIALETKEGQQIHLTILEVLMGARNVSDDEVRVVEMGLQHHLEESVVERGWIERSYISESSQVTVVLESSKTNKIIKFYGQYFPIELISGNDYFPNAQLSLCSIWLPRLFNSRGNVC